MTRPATMNLRSRVDGVRAAAPAIARKAGIRVAERVRGRKTGITSAEINAASNGGPSHSSSIALSAVQRRAANAAESARLATTSMITAATKDAAVNASIGTE